MEIKCWGIIAYNTNYGFIQKIATCLLLAKQCLYIHVYNVLVFCIETNPWWTSFLCYFVFFKKSQHVLNSPEQNVQIFSRIWYMIYAFIIVKGIPSPEQDQEKNFHLTCQKLAVEKKKNMKIGYKSRENLRSKIH